MGRIVEVPHNIDIDEIIKNKGAGYTPDFSLFTAGIESDRHYPDLVHMVGSSTEVDMQGDMMSLHALNDMTRCAPNLTIWLNHDYNLPDSLFGSMKGAPSIMHKEGVADLHFDADVEMSNPKAAQVKKYIDNGRRLGVSVGCMVTKYEVPTEEDGPGWQEKGITIHGVYTVEYSVVGIPASQRSWVENAIRGVYSRTFDPALAPAMKSLWPNQYKKIVKSAPDHLRDAAEKMPARSPMEARLEYIPAQKYFVFTKQDTKKAFSPDEVRTLFKGENATGQESIEAKSDNVDERFDFVEDLSDSQNDNVAQEVQTSEISATIETVQESGVSPEAESAHSDAEGDANDDHQEEENETGDSGERADRQGASEGVSADVDTVAAGPVNDAHALLKSYNAIGALLNLPELSELAYTKAWQAQKKAQALLQRSSSDDASKLKMMHDIVVDMAGNAVCSNDTDDFVSSQQQSDLASGRQPAMQYNLDLSTQLEALTKSIEKHERGVIDLIEQKQAVEIVKKELVIARQELDTINAEIQSARETVEAIKDMPMGNPVHHSRTVHPEDNVAKYDDFIAVRRSLANTEPQAVDSLSQAFALTKVERRSFNDGTFMRYRYWPVGVGGSVEKGVRPPLTSNQITFMDFTDIKSYRDGGEAKVPYLDNQVEDR